MQRALILYCVLLSAPGCGQAARESARGVPAEYSAEATGEAAESAAAEAGDLDVTHAADPERKIIYEADISLVVTDFPRAESEVPRLAKEHGGYLADVSIDRTAGEHRFGRWQVRIPVDRFEPFLDALSDLGVPENRRQTAQDVTEEYIDLEARIANKKRLEERILELLQVSEGAIKDVIEVERELERVRSEIEQMEGRLRYLTNRIALTTVTITVREQRDYVPPEAPTFLARIRQSWANSLVSLRRFGENVFVAIVAAIPWLVVLSVVVGPLIWRMRRRRAMRRRAAASGDPRPRSSSDRPEG